MPVTLPEVIISHPSDLVNCLKELTEEPQIAFDTEFIGEKTYIPHLCLVQVATRKKLYLIDPLKCGPLDDFWRVLTRPDKQVIVHSGREELRICQRACGKVPYHVVDVQIGAGLIGLGYPLNYAAIVQKTTSQRIEKSETLTDWGQRPLTKEQIRYAFEDVRDLLAVWDNVNRRLENKGRLSWAEEDFASFVKRSLVEEEEIERWRKLKGSSSLDRRRLAILRSVYLWREEQAHRLNRPTRFVLRDDLVVEIAKRNPRRETDVRSLRGIGRLDIRSLLDAVAEANDLPEEQLPKEAEKDFEVPSLGQCVSVLNLILADWCATQSIAQQLVSTTSDLKKLVKAWSEKAPIPEDCAFAKGWRATHVYPFLKDVLDGKICLKILPPGGEGAFQYLRDYQATK